MSAQQILTNIRHGAVFSLCMLAGALLAAGLSAEETPLPILEEEQPSTVWETGHGDPYCSFEPPELPVGFFFNDFSRWSQTATDPPSLAHGDPSTLTWGFINDGVNITASGNGSCTGPTSVSDLIAVLDTIRDPASTGGADLTQRLWFPVFQQIFTDWGLLNGINYVYESNDDGAAFHSALGVVGVRADVRIGGHLIDGQSGSNVLACNFFPNNGDMILDTTNTTFYANTTNNSRGLRNVLGHEHGHGMGISHVCPINQTKLMEPFISTAFDGPQVDDVNAANRAYGDRDEFPGHNDTSATATLLGAVTQSGVPVTRLNLSIDSTSDTDFYGFSVLAGSQATVTLSPTGSTYLNGPQNPNGSCTAGTNFNSLAQSDLALEIRGTSGANILGSADVYGAGIAETVANVVLHEGPGTYFVRASSLNDANQMYDLSVSTTAAGCVPDAFEPDSEIDGSEAMPITPGVTKNHSICPVGDNDWSTFTLTEDNGIVLETSGPGPPDDTLMKLFMGSSLTFVESHDDILFPSNRYSKIDRLCGVDSLLPGTYFVEVEDFADDDEILSYALDLTVTPCPCPATVELDNDTLAGTQTFQATMTATLGPALVIDGTHIRVRGTQVVTFLNGVEIGGTFTASNTPVCAP